MNGFVDLLGHHRIKKEFEMQTLCYTLVLRLLKGVQKTTLWHMQHTVNRKLIWIGNISMN